MSVPSAVSTRPAATAAAEPEEEPPGTLTGRGAVAQAFEKGIFAENAERNRR